MSLVLLSLLVSVTALLVPYIFHLIRHSKELLRALWLTRKIPGPPEYPIVGSLPTAVWIWKDMHNAIYDLLEKYGSTVRLWVADRILILVMDPADVEVICTHRAFSSKPDLYRLLSHHLGTALLTMTGGPDYRRHRKAITPSLHFDILQDFVPIFAKNAAFLLEHLEEKADAGETFDALHLFGMMTSKSVTETVLSTHLGSSTNELTDIAVSLELAGKVMMWRVVRPWWQNDIVFKLSSRYAKFRDTARTIHEVVERILHKRSAEVAAGVLPTPRRRMAFLDHVLRSSEGANLSPEELTDELKTLLFAGSSTSMDFMSFVAVLLSLLPHIQLRVQQELDDVFGEDRDRAVQAEDLPQLRLLERVLKEALRYGPPAPVFFRSAQEDVLLPSGHLLARGCVVALVPSGTHRLPSHFPDPERFDPDRFLPENSRGRHPFAYVPFSAGMRNCIGQRYALMFAKTAFATLLRRISFVRAPEMPSSPRQLKVEMGITMSIQGGAKVRAERRK